MQQSIGHTLFLGSVDVLAQFFFRGKTRKSEDTGPIDGAYPKASHTLVHIYPSNGYFRYGMSFALKKDNLFFAIAYLQN